MTAVLGPPGKRVVTGHVHLPGRSDAVERYRARRLAQLARDAGTKRAHRRTAPEAATPMLSWWQRLPSPNITQPSARRSTGGPGFGSPRFRISVRVDRPGFRGDLI